MVAAQLKRKPVRQLQHTMSSRVTFKIAIPAFEGFYGRQCNDSRCGRYFKVAEASLRDQMHCPYCGVLTDNDALWTHGQIQFAQDRAIEEMTDHVADQFSKMMRDAFRGSKHVKFKPGRRSPRRRARPPEEPLVDSELQCPDCETTFQVFGIFGYCPGCSSENLLLYDANLAVIRQEISQSTNPNRTLRHAYSDVVSTFETFCAREAERRGVGSAHFQNIDSTRRKFRKELGVDILGGFSTSEKRLLKRVFAKRHVLEHNRGIANERYVKAVPEDAHVLGQQVPLSPDEFEAAAGLLRQCLGALVDARPSTA